MRSNFTTAAHANVGPARLPCPIRYHSLLASPSSIAVASRPHLNHLFELRIFLRPPRSRQLQPQQRRSYIFLPSTAADVLKSIRELVTSRKETTLRLALRLRTRWDEKRIRVHKLLDQRRRNARLKRSIRIRALREGRLSRFLLLQANGAERFRRAVVDRAERGRGRIRSRIDAVRRRRRNASVTRGGRRFLLSSPPSSSSTLSDEEARNIPRVQKRVVTLTEPAYASWFDPDGYPLTSRDPLTGRFVNPWNSESTNGDHGLSPLVRWRWERITGGCAEDMEPPPSSSFTSLLSSVPPSIADDGGGAASAARRRTVGGGWLGYWRRMLCGSPAYPAWRRLGGGSSLSDTSSAEEKVNIDDEEESSSPPSSSFNLPASSPDKIRLTWIGHSTTLVRMSSFVILTDPHFSDRAGPAQLPVFGIGRYAPPSMSVEDLPPVVDAVLISHDHYDHLDYWTVIDLVESRRVKYWVVPLGLKRWLMDKAGVQGKDIIELEWWEGVRFSKRGFGGGDGDGDVHVEVEGLVSDFDGKGRRPAMDDSRSEVWAEGEALASGGRMHAHEMVVTCAPSQHWCSRTPFDRNRRLWCSWAVRTSSNGHDRFQTDEKAATLTSIPDSLPDAAHQSKQERTELNFYFAGDTGLPPSFPLHRQIGDRLGPFDLAALPIGAYAPSFFMRDSHCDPSEAVRIHRDVRSKRSVAVHWGSFALADERYDEPPRLLREAVHAANEELERDVLHLGEEGLSVERLNAADIVDFIAIRQGETVESRGSNTPRATRSLHRSAGGDGGASGADNVEDPDDERPVAHAAG